MSLYRKHLALMTYFDQFVPKHHVVVHLVHRLLFLGNPSWYSNWTDESLNRMLKACCRHVSQSTVEWSLLLRMRDLLMSSNRDRPPRDI